MGKPTKDSLDLDAHDIMELKKAMVELAKNNAGNDLINEFGEAIASHDLSRIVLEYCKMIDDRGEKFTSIWAGWTMLNMDEMVSSYLVSGTSPNLPDSEIYKDMIVTHGNDLTCMGVSEERLIELSNMARDHFSKILILPEGQENIFERCYPPEISNAYYQLMKLSDKLPEKAYLLANATLNLNNFLKQEGLLQIMQVKTGQDMAGNKHDFTRVRPTTSPFSGNC